MALADRDSHMQEFPVEGSITKVFINERTAAPDRAEAKASHTMERCVRLTAHPEAFDSEGQMKPESTWRSVAQEHPEYLRNDRGLPLVADFYPFFPWNKKMVKEPDAEEPRRLRLKDYGCSVAVDLYLRLQIEGFCLFSFLFLISIPDMQDNLERNQIRRDCRAAVKDGDSPWPSSCGYGDLPIRTNASLIQWPSTGYVRRTPLSNCRPPR